MLIKILIILYIMTYAVIVSQSFSYIISLRNVYMSLKAPSYIELRHLTDREFMAKFKWVMYTGLVMSIGMVVVAAFSSSSLFLLSSVYACIALFFDTIIAIRGNIPVNTVINSWTKESYPDDWATYRILWFRYFRLRQIANISGFVVLLVGVLFA